MKRRIYILMLILIISVLAISVIGSGGIFSKHLRIGIPFKAVMVSDLDSYFYFNGVEHTMTLINYTNESIELESEPTVIKLVLNETKEVEFEDGILRIYFMKMKRTFKTATATLQLTSLEMVNETNATLNITAISESQEENLTIEEEIVEEIEEFEEPDLEAISVEEEKGSSQWGVIAIGILAAVIIIALVIYVGTRKKKENV